MKLGLDTIAKLGDKGNDKAAVSARCSPRRTAHSALGTYSFDKNGDTTLTDYGLYKVGSDGNPTFEKTIKAARPADHLTRRGGAGSGPPRTASRSLTSMEAHTEAPGASAPAPTHPARRVTGAAIRAFAQHLRAARLSCSPSR